MMARFAMLHMAAQRGRAATRDRMHHAVMHGCKPTRMRTLVGHAVLAKDIRHLERGSHRRRPTQKYVGAGGGCQACCRLNSSRSLGLDMRRFCSGPIEPHLVW